MTEGWHIGFGPGLRMWWQLGIGTYVSEMVPEATMAQNDATRLLHVTWHIGHAFPFVDRGFSPKQLGFVMFRFRFDYRPHPCHSEARPVGRRALLQPHERWLPRYIMPPHEIFDAIIRPQSFSRRSSWGLMVLWNTSGPTINQDLAEKVVWPGDAPSVSC